MNSGRRGESIFQGVSGVDQPASGQKNLPSVLGTEGFIKRIKGKFVDKRRHREIHESKFLVAAADRIKEEVCKFLVWIELSYMNQEGGSQINPEMSRFICLGL